MLDVCYGDSSLGFFYTDVFLIKLESWSRR